MRQETRDEAGFSRAEGGRGMVVVRDEERSFRLRGASNDSTNRNPVSRETLSQERDNPRPPRAPGPPRGTKVRGNGPSGMLVVFLGRIEGRGVDDGLFGGCCGCRGGTSLPCG